MLGKKGFQTFLSVKNEHAARTGIPPEWRCTLTSMLLLAFPIGFWVSVMLRLALGTDYLFDVVFDQVGQNPFGNGILVALVVFCPGVAVGYNGLYRIHHNKSVWSGITIAGMLLLAAGFFAAMKRG